MRAVEGHDGPGFVCPPPDGWVEWSYPNAEQVLDALNSQRTGWCGPCRRAYVDHLLEAARVASLCVQLDHDGLLPQLNDIRRVLADVQADRERDRAASYAAGWQGALDHLLAQLDNPDPRQGAST